MKLPFVSRKKYEKAERELFLLKEERAAESRQETQVAYNRAVENLRKNEEIHDLRKKVRSQEETLYIYRALLKNVVDVDSVKTVLDNEKEVSQNEH